MRVPLVTVAAMRIDLNSVVLHHSAGLKSDHKINMEEWRAINE